MNGKANERELLYGEKLGKIIRCETISNAFQQISVNFTDFMRFWKSCFRTFTKSVKSMSLTEVFFLSGREKARESPFSL